MTSEEEQTIVDAFKENQSSSLRTVQKNQDLNPKQVSYVTISKTLKNEGLNAFKIPTIQFITEQQKKERLSFAQKVKIWTRKWKSVSFTDEIIMQKGMVGNKFIWHYSRDDIQSKSCNQKKKFSKYLLHLWGTVSYDKSLYLTTINRKLDSDSYQSILTEFIEQTKEVEDDKYFEDKLFQQDLASCHQSRSTKEFLENQGLNELEQSPPKGADISPIEKIWAILKEEMIKLDNELDNESIFKALQSEFMQSKKIKIAIKKLYTSLPNKIQKVIQKRGEQIDI